MFGYAELTAIGFRIVFSSVDRFIAATGFVRSPMGSPRRHHAVSLAPQSPPLGGPRT